MKIIKITHLKDLKQIEKGETIVVDLTEAKPSDSKVAIYFLAGLAFNDGELKKLSNAKYLVKQK